MLPIPTPSDPLARAERDLLETRLPEGWKGRLENHPIATHIVAALAFVVATAPFVRTFLEGLESASPWVSLADDILSALVVAFAGLLGTRKSYGPITVREMQAEEYRRRLALAESAEASKVEGQELTGAIIYAEALEAEEAWRDEWEEELDLASEAALEYEEEQEGEILWRS